MRALIYARVSQDSQGTGRSVAEQEAESRAECDRRGWTVVDAVRDNSLSASRFAKAGRPGWDTVKRRLTDGEADVLVSWEASRATRSLDEFTTLRRVCRSAKVLLCWSGKLIDLSSTDGSFDAGLSMLLAERESDVTSDRIKRAMSASAAKGRPPGRRLFGYRRLHDPTTGVLVGQEPDPTESRVIRELVDRVLGGESPWSVCQDLNRRGVTTNTGAEWTIRSAKRTLLNPHYTARRVHQGQVVGPADWPPIVTDDEHAQLTTLYGDPERKRHIVAPGTIRHLLSGVVRCGVCGGGVYVNLANRGRPRYQCKRAHVVCEQATLDSHVTGLVTDRLSRLAIEPAAPSDGAQESAAESELASLTERRDEIRAAFARGTVPLSTLEAVERELDVATRSSETSIRRLRSRRLPPQLIGKDAVEMFSKLDLVSKRGVIAAIVRVELLPAGKGKRTFDPATRLRVTWL